eukprot:SAG31_NODE_20938_length_561_cov_1.768398_2_plen_96_part_01
MQADVAESGTQVSAVKNLSLFFIAVTLAFLRLAFSAAFLENAVPTAAGLSSASGCGSKPAGSTMGVTKWPTRLDLPAGFSLRLRAAPIGLRGGAGR